MTYCCCIFFSICYCILFIFWSKSMQISLVYPGQVSFAICFHLFILTYSDSKKTYMFVSEIIQIYCTHTLIKNLDRTVQNWTEQLEIICGWQDLQKFQVPHQVRLCIYYSILCCFISQRGKQHNFWKRWKCFTLANQQFSEAILYNHDDLIEDGSFFSSYHH